MLSSPILNNLAGYHNTVLKPIWHFLLTKMLLALSPRYVAAHFRKGFNLIPLSALSIGDIVLPNCPPFCTSLTNGAISPGWKYATTAMVMLMSTASKM